MYGSPGIDMSKVYSCLFPIVFHSRLSIQFTDIGDTSVTGTVHIGHSSACRSMYMCFGT